jgi:DNA polymerase-2
LESVRRDWPSIAKRLQRGLLKRLFQDEELLPFVKEMIESVRSGEADGELVYTKRIRKGSLDRYTASSPPHVQAARKLEARQGRKGGGVIHYLITTEGPEPLMGFDPENMTIDRAHYVQKVLRPVAEAILSEVGSSFSEALGEPQQLDLI